MPTTAHEFLFISLDRVGVLALAAHSISTYVYKYSLLGYELSSMIRTHYENYMRIFVWRCNAVFKKPLQRTLLDWAQC